MVDAAWTMVTFIDVIASNSITTEATSSIGTASIYMADVGIFDTCIIIETLETVIGSASATEITCASI